MTSLVIRESPDGAPASWVPWKWIALPTEASSAAWAIARGEELRVWVNQPGSGTTTQARVDAEGVVRSAARLPWLLAGVAADERTTLITGTDAGEPIVAALNDAGEPEWQHRIEGAAPLQWPMPALLPEPAIVWQSQAREVRLAEVGAEGLSRVRGVAVNAPSPKITVVGDSCWAAWLDGDGVSGQRIELDPSRERPPVHWSLTGAKSFALGCDERGLRAAWSSGGSGQFGRLDPVGGAAFDREALDLGDAVNGTLRIPGEESLVWAQRIEVFEPEPPRWINALAAPGEQACMVDGLVHAVARWRNRLALVGKAEILILQRRSP